MGEQRDQGHKTGIKQGLNPCFTTFQPSEMQNEDYWAYRVVIGIRFHNVYKALSTEPGVK